jgi:hypothetical protein
MEITVMTRALLQAFTTLLGLSRTQPDVTDIRIS